MKKFIPTLILVVLCIGGFWYARHQSFFKEKDPNANKQLMTVKAGDVQSISIDSGESIQLSKKVDSWEMSKPAAYPVGKFNADGWVTSFTGLTYETKIDEKPADLAPFGLDKPSKQYQVTLNDGSVKKLLIGNPLPVAGTSYAKLDDSPVVYEMTDQTIQGIDKKTFDFLDKSAFTFQYDKIQSLAIDWKGDKWSLQKAEADKSVYDSKWKLDDKEIQPNEGAAVLDKLINMNTDQMVKPAAEVNMSSPEMKVELGQDDGSGKVNTTLYTGKIDKDTIWIVKQGGPWAYQLPISNIQDWYDKGKTTLTASPSPSPSPSASPAK